MTPHRPAEGTLLDPARSDGGAARDGQDGAGNTPKTGTNTPTEGTNNEG
jgi:hypothetical protein